MKCNKCGSEWKTDVSGSASMTICPFCKESYVEKDKPEFYDNSKDALAAIMQRFGPDILLGKLNSYFSDIAPMVPRKEKELVYYVYEKGAAKILKKYMTASQADKEIAVKLAIRELTDAFIMADMAEAIIMEFTNALGWQINQRKTNKYKVGDIIQFGKYDWRVLENDREKERCLILSERIIIKKPYHDPGGDITWEKCTLRTYLNKEFYDTFNEKDRNRIVQTRIYNYNNLWFDIAGGNDTLDMIFLLSIEEVDRYFGNSGEYLQKQQEKVASYRNHQKMSTDSILDRLKMQFAFNDMEMWLSNDHNEERRAKYKDEEEVFWWLRTPGRYSDYATFVDNYGIINVVGMDADDNWAVVINANRGLGVRPALWISY